jgi:hypothetical protein
VLAEAYVEEASAPEHVVSDLSLAYKHFRTEVLEPLLAVPRPKREGKKKNKGRRGGDGPSTATVISSVAEVDKQLFLMYLGCQYELSTY